MCNKLNWTVSATVASLVLGFASANAADILEAVPTGRDWTGAYIGLNAGYAFSNNEVSAESVGTTSLQVLFDATGTDTLDLDPDGFIGGGQIGYNWQMDSIVLGIEADAQYTEVRGSETVHPVGLITGFRGSQELDFLATLRARLGLAVSEGILIYATGGLAVGEVDLDTQFTASNFSGTDDWIGGASETQWGWTAGAGAEIMLADNISLKAEYIYVDLGDESLTAPGNIFPASEILEFTFENQFHIVRAGLNWHF